MALSRQNVKDIQVAIKANKKNFKGGSSFDQQTMLSLASKAGITVPTYRTKFKTLADAHAYSLQIVNAYTSFNKILAPRGMVIKSKNYYSKFTVYSGDWALDIANNYLLAGARKTKFAADLHGGVAAYPYGRFKTLSNPEINRISGGSSL